MTIKKSRFNFNIVLTIMMFVCTIFSGIKFFSYFAIVFFGVYLICLWLYDKTFFLKYLAFVFTSVGTIAGVVVIELFPSMYLSELRCQSDFVGSLPLLIVGYWIFLLVLEIMDNRYKQSINDMPIDLFENEKYQKKINLIASFALIPLIMLLCYAISHFPAAFSLNIDRFTYASNFNFPWILSKFKNIAYLFVCMCLLALIYANKGIGVIGVAVYFMYFLWTGEKFGPFWSVLCIMAIVYYNKFLSIEKSKRRKIIKTAMIIFTVLILLAVYIASNTLNINSYDYFVGRAAQQGQLWWRTYDLYGGNIHPNEFVNEINAFFEGDKPNQECIGAKNGIYKVMYLCAPESVVTNKLFSGSRYTQADYAVVYYYFGFPGVVVYSILMGLIISGIVNSFILSLQNKDYIKAMIYLRFFTMIRASFSMFTCGGFISLLSILSYLYLIFTHLSKLRFRLRQKVNMQTKRVRIKNE